MTAADLAARLEARKRGTGCQAKCPAHADDRASLSIGSGDDDRVLLKCHAGCGVDAIVEALGLTTSDLFPQRAKTKKATTKRAATKIRVHRTPVNERTQTIIGVYDYEDEQNNLLYQVVRFEPKDFRQRRPDGKGGWIWNTTKVRRVLYHLPDLKARIENPEYRRQSHLPDDIVIPEGEKDVDKLWSRGLIATTNPGGAGKWRDEYTQEYAQQLVDAGARRIIILPHNDDPGRQHAADVARSCQGAGLAVQIIHLTDLPPKGDVSDWLDAGHRIEDLVQIVTSTPTTDLATALANTKDFVRRYVVLSDHQSVLTALWVAQTHVLDAFDYAAYLNIHSPMPECGKSRFLEVLEALVANPWLTGRVTAAVLMRKVDAEHPVLLLDESDAAFNGDETYTEALRGMLNSGFHRSGKASACVGQGASLTYRDFSTFGLKAIAGIGKLPSTVESRSIPIALKRRTKDEAIAKWRRDAAWQAAGVVQSALQTALADLRDGLRAARPALPEGLSDRAEDVLEPLFALADAAGGTWPELARNAAGALMGYAARQAQEADQDLGLELLADINGIITAKERPEGAIHSAEILEGLLKLEDRPWTTFTKDDKPLTLHKLSRLLKPFKVLPAGNVQVGSIERKGYRLAAFADAFARYLPSKASERRNTNGNGAIGAKTEASTDRPATDSKTPVSSITTGLDDASTLSTPDHEKGGAHVDGDLF